MQTEQELAGFALALLGRDRVHLSAPEAKVARAAVRPFHRHEIARTRQEITRGADPLGEAFSRIRSPVVRRADGATYTPAPIVRAMVRWAATVDHPSRIVDAGAGSGRFLLAAAQVFRAANLVAIERDPLAALILRANLAVRNLLHRTQVLVGDYRGCRLMPIAGRTLFIGNPPYVRHHAIANRWKQWLRRSASALGIDTSALAGLHVHFLVRTMQVAREGDFGVFVTSAEWLDVNYGVTVRRLLADGMGGVSLHLLDAKSMPFDAMTTAAIVCFHIGHRAESMLVRHVAKLSNLGSLERGRSVPWDVLEQSSKWSTIVRRSPRPSSDHVELGEVCRVHRGQVTGNNAVWIANANAALLPGSVLVPTVTRARELIAAQGALKDAAPLRRVVNLPADLDMLSAEEREAVQRFLRWARGKGADRSYIAQHRQPWWAVNLRPAAPIICTYMARRPPAFVRNLCDARHINIAHGLYPREPMRPHVLDALAAWLTTNVGVENGRTYAGGLIKFEPRELERVQIPRPETLIAHGRSSAMV